MENENTKIDNLNIQLLSTVDLVEEREDEELCEIIKPKDYFLWSFLNLFMFFWLFGIIALIFTILTNKKATLKRKLIYSKLSFIFNLASTLIGLIFIIGAIFDGTFRIEFEDLYYQFY